MPDKRQLLSQLRLHTRGSPANVPTENPESAVFSEVNDFLCERKHARRKTEFFIPVTAHTCLSELDSVQAHVLPIFFKGSKSN